MNIIRTNIHHETTVSWPRKNFTKQETAELIKRQEEAIKRFTEKYGRSPFEGHKK